MSLACLICERPYDINNCKPLVLPCGHAMCRECLLKFEGWSKICIVCNKSWADSSVESLPVCLPLIPGENTKPVRTLWCNTCRSSACGKKSAKENDNCDVIPLGEKCLRKAIEHNEICKKISTKKSYYEKFLEEIASFSQILKEEICRLSHMEKHNNEHNIDKDDSDEKTLAILADNMKLCVESMATKLPVTISSTLLSPVLHALQVNCYLMTINFQSLLHHCCLPSCLLSR